MTNIYNTEPTYFPSKNNGNEVCHNSSFGPCFGNGKDLGIFVNNRNYTKFPESYQDNLGKSKSIFTGDFNNNNEKIELNEIEVFKIYNE